MSKKYIRYFGGFIETEQRWLNAMSAKGYRLVRRGRLSFEFEPCDPDQYQYYVDFVGHKSNSEQEHYMKFLREVGYRVIKIATSPGKHNKELLIIERLHDDRPFAHTTIEDKITYYKPKRDAHLLLFLLSLFLFIWNSFVKGEWFILSTWLYFSASAITFITTVFYQKHIHKLKSRGI